MLVVYGRGPSARAIAGVLGCPHYLPNVSRRRPSGISVVNWGSVYEGPHSRALNSWIVFNKRTQLERMSMAGVPVPEYSGVLPDAADGAIWLGRRNTHRGGTDICVCRASTTERPGPLIVQHMPCTCQCGHRHSVTREVAGPPIRETRWDRHGDQSDFYTQYIQKDREFRVHAFDGAVLRIAEKQPNNPASIAWGNEHSHFRYFQNDGPQGLRDTLVQHALTAVGALGMDFGAVDVIWKRRSTGGEFYVLEVNSAPAVYDNINTLAAYRDAIRSWYEQRSGSGCGNGLQPRHTL